MMQKINIILYGEANSGKTTSLMKLAAKLGGRDVAADIDKNFKKGTRYKDARFIVEYKEKLIYIGTCGDTWAACREHTECFAGNYSNKQIFLISGGIVHELSPSEKNTYKTYTLNVCVCACRPSGDGYGAIKALHSYSEKAILEYKQQIWIRKDRDTDCDAQAEELKDIIDGIGGSRKSLKKE